jgi:membrane protein
LLSVGAGLGAIALTFGTFSKLAEMAQGLPFGGVLAGQITWVAPLLAFLSIVILLTLFYRLIPNTSVSWRPALLGAIIIALLLYLNQKLSFLYIGQVIRQQSLLGAVGILPVLLFGLFLFWMLLLLGGQLTFAIQNVNTLTNQRAWEHTSSRTREMLCVSAMLKIARRFQEAKHPYSGRELAELLRTPSNLVNMTLERLCDVKLLVAISETNGKSEVITRYQPARPLASISIGDIHEKLVTYGNNEGASLLKNSDPALAVFRDLLAAHANALWGAGDLQQLVTQHLEPQAEQGAEKRKDTA